MNSFYLYTHLFSVLSVMKNVSGKSLMILYASGGKQCRNLKKLSMPNHVLAALLSIKHFQNECYFANLNTQKQQHNSNYS